MAEFPSDQYKKTAVWRLQGERTHTLPRSNIFMYVLQSFLDVPGDQLGWGDTSISLKVCRCLQYIPIVVLIQKQKKKKKRSQEKKDWSCFLQRELHYAPNYSPLAFAQGKTLTPWPGQTRPAHAGHGLACPPQLPQASCWQLFYRPSDPTQPFPGTLTWTSLWISASRGVATGKGRREAKRGVPTLRVTQPRPRWRDSCTLGRSGSEPRRKPGTSSQLSHPEEGTGSGALRACGKAEVRGGLARRLKGQTLTDSSSPHS